MGYLWMAWRFRKAIGLAVGVLAVVAFVFWVRSLQASVATAEAATERAVMRAISLRAAYDKERTARHAAQRALGISQTRAQFAARQAAGLLQRVGASEQAREWGAGGLPAAMFDELRVRRPAAGGADRAGTTAAAPAASVRSGAAD